MPGFDTGIESRAIACGNSEGTGPSLAPFSGFSMTIRTTSYRCAPLTFKGRVVRRVRIRQNAPAARRLYAPWKRLRITLG